MKTRITELEAIKGKCVVEVCKYPWDKLCLHFEDGAYFVISAENNYDLAELCFEDGLNDHEQKQLGIISEAEYDKREAAEQRQRDLETEANQKALYNKLKAKYGDV